MLMNKETIASITTPVGEGGIGIIQVSGPDSLEIVNAVFRGKKNKDLRNAESKRLYYGEIHLNGTAVDEVIVNVLRKEDSFTGEDLVEVNCHGGIRAVKKTLECIVSTGAKEAHWKELANRSFINDKIDLIQKEALLEIPQAKTRLGVKVLLDQYNGALSSFINNLINEIEHGNNNINQSLSSIRNQLREILETAVFGCAITSPQKLIITGKPNVGKSTLINALLREDRSIVHSEPGTTRDAVDSMFSISGIPFTIVDTAGIRETNHVVERLGVLESKKQLEQADKIIFMLDYSRPVEREDKELMEFITERLQTHKTGNSLNKVTVVTVVNKTDLPCELNLSTLGTKQFNSTCQISASKGDGISGLEEDLIVEFKKYTEYVPEKPIIFTRRQQECLSKTLGVSGQYIHLIKEDNGPDNCLKALSDIKQNLLNCVGTSDVR
jgi:tRNA modification GTPase